MIIDYDWHDEELAHVIHVRIGEKIKKIGPPITWDFFWTDL